MNNRTGHWIIPLEDISRKCFLILFQLTSEIKTLQILSLGVTHDSTFTNPNVQRMSSEDRLKYYASRCSVALYIACHRGHKTVARALLDKGNGLAFSYLG